jgi:outer membrane protein TolC
MDFVVPFRCQRLASGHKPRPGLLGRSFAAIALFLAVAAIAQRKEPRIPDAPRPNSSLLQAQPTNHPASFVDSDDSSAAAEPAPGAVSFYTVADLALRNSKSVLIGEADVRRLEASLRQIRDYYIPSLAVGSGLGYSYGFPLGTPNIFNVTSTSLLVSFSQRDYMRSSRAAIQAAALSLKDTRQQVILDTALNYIDLKKTLDQISALKAAVSDSDQLLSIMNERRLAGLETDIQMTQARLGQAQIRLRQIQMEDHADEIRKHLSDLTGLDAVGIVPLASSIPELPDLHFPTLKNNEDAPAVQAAFAKAKASLYQYWGDKRQNYRPTINFVLQYQRFSTFNGYQSYYLTPPGGFPLNNLGVGIQAVLPLFDAVKQTKAEESRAEATREWRQAEMTSIQNSESNFALWHSLRELEAQEQVADLQQQIAQLILTSTVTQMKGPATANGAPVAPQQAEQQRIDERNSYVDLRDAQFNVAKVKLNLLNAVGGLEDWAKESTKEGNPPPANMKARSGSRNPLH